MSTEDLDSDEILSSLATTDRDWQKHLNKPGLRVVDAYAKWAGICQPMVIIFKKLKVEFGDGITFIEAQTDSIEALVAFRDNSCPTFLILYDGVIVKVVHGADAPLLERLIKEQFETERIGGSRLSVIFLNKIKSIAKSQLLADSLKVQESTPVYSEPIEVTLTREILPQENIESHAPIRIAEIPDIDSTIPTQTFALIKPDSMSCTQVEGLFNQIKLKRFNIIKKKKVWLTATDVKLLYKEHQSKSFFNSLIIHLTTGPCIVLVLSRENAVIELLNLVGPSSREQDVKKSPTTLREFFGEGNQINSVLGSNSAESAGREIELFFGANTVVLEMVMNEEDYSVANSNEIEKTLCIIKIENDVQREDIIERIVCRGIDIIRREEVLFNNQHVQDLYPELINTEKFLESQGALTRVPFLALVLQGEDVTRVWNEMAGPENPLIAKDLFPSSIRALFGVDEILNGVHASQSVEKALHEVNIFFPFVLERRNTNTVVVDARYGSSTNPFPVGHTASKQDLHAMLERSLALIKPDAYGSGKKDAIVAKIIEAGFTIVKESEVQFNLAQAQEFYKEHQTKAFYQELVNWMSGTPIYALVLEKESAITAWRELAGPTNSIKAREIAPSSVRAEFGKDGTYNAVHGSDSPASAEREIRIVFGDQVSSFPEPLESILNPNVHTESRRVSQVEARWSMAKDTAKSIESLSKEVTLKQAKSVTNNLKAISGSKKSLAGSIASTTAGLSKTNIKSSGPLGIKSKTNSSGSAAKISPKGRSSVKSVKS